MANINITFCFKNNPAKSKNAQPMLKNVEKQQQKTVWVWFG